MNASFTSAVHVLSLFHIIIFRKYRNWMPVLLFFSSSNFHVFCAICSNYCPFFPLRLFSLNIFSSQLPWINFSIFLSDVSFCERIIMSSGNLTHFIFLPTTVAPPLVSSSLFITSSKYILNKWTKDKPLSHCSTNSCTMHSDKSSSTLPSFSYRNITSL